LGGLQGGRDSRVRERERVRRRRHDGHSTTCEADDEFPVGSAR